MRLLGIDYGRKRVGVAMSDEALIFAYPLEVIENSLDLMRRIKQIALDNNIGGVIVGESSDFSGKHNPIMVEILPFAEELKQELHIPVEFHPEFMTSQAAERFQGKNDLHDASAAALILQSYLDTKNNQKK